MKTYFYTFALLIVSLVLLGASGTPAEATGPVVNAVESTFTAAHSGSSFVPLTQIPAFQDVANQDNLVNFFNSLYKYCIGIAAVLAVLQIMRAGLMYMSPDSITEKAEARNLIGLSIFGLILVLSPVIVFGLIDSRILNLHLDLSSLRMSTGSGTSNNNSGGSGTQTTGNPTTNQPTGQPDTTPLTGTDAGTGTGAVVQRTYTITPTPEHEPLYYVYADVFLGTPFNGDPACYVVYAHERVSQQECQAAVARDRQPIANGDCVNHAVTFQYSHENLCAAAAMPIGQ